MRIDQYLPDFAPHDAIGNHVLAVQSVLRGAGYESDIWADVIHPPLAGRARHYLEDDQGPDRRGGDVAIYHASTHSDMAGWLEARARAGQRLAAIYHNITPARYFDRWEPAAAAGCRAARAELAALAPVTELALAVSAFNQAELVAAGYRATAVSPLLIDLDGYHRRPDARAMAALERRRAGGGSHWLFVGRLAPNKCPHDVIGAFAAYRAAFDPAAQLTLVGSTTSARYQRALLGLVAELGLAGAVDMPGSLPLGSLLAHFATADVFVCCSEHEGFCVPLIEAMELGVPVVAYAAAAVPETAATAAVLLDGKDPLEVAVAVAAVLDDGGRRRALVDAGRARAADFCLARTSAQLLDCLHRGLGV